MTTLTERTIATLRERITSGSFCGASHLPSEQSLADEIGVSRCIIRNALGVLERDGLLHRLPGLGRIPVARTRALVRDAIMVLGNPPSSSDCPQGYLNAVDAGAIDAARQLGETVLVMSLTAARERTERLAQDPPKGLIVGPEIELVRTHAQLVHQLAGHGTAVAVCSNDAEWAPYDRVVTDQESGGREMTAHLLERGLRRIALMAPGTGEPHDWWLARQRGYAAAMAAAGLPTLPPVPNQHLVGRPGGFDQANYENRVRATVGWLAAPLAAPDAPEALIALSDGDVFPIMAASRLLSRQLMVAGYDAYWQDAWERRLTADVPCATIDKDNPGIGRRLAGALAERLADPSLPPRLILHPPRLVVTPPA